MKRLLVLLLGLSFAPLLSAEGLDLSIPDSPAEIKKVMGDDAPCKGCGVVTNVRQLTPVANQTPPPQDSAYAVTFAEATRAGPGDDFDLTGARVNAVGKSPGGAWQTTVRYDDGSYAAHESEMQPSFQEGDRVQVISGKLVPR
jgi:hypothetical protein